MSNKLIIKIKNDYMATGLSEREANNEAIKTYREIRADIMHAEDQIAILKQYGLGAEWLGDVI